MTAARTGKGCVMGTGLIGIVVILVALVALAVWTRVHRGRADSGDKRGLPADRPTTWDPRERYE